MRIFHVVELCVGGIATFIDGLLDYQCSDSRVGAVCVAADHSRTAPWLIAKHKSSFLNYGASRNPLQFRRAFEEIADHAAAFLPDVIHLHSTFPGAYVRAFRNRLKGHAPIVYTAHGWSFDQRRSGSARLVCRMIERYLSTRTDALVHISEYEAAVARAAGVQAPIEAVIRHSVRETRLRGTKPFRAHEGELNLLYVGRLDYSKGVDLLPRLIDICQRKDITIYIAGGAILGDVTVSASPKIISLGWIKPDEIDEYYACADAVIIPSRHEGFGLVALEAMRNSKPILVSNQGALPELVIHGFNGWIFDINDLPRLAAQLLSVTKEDFAQMGHNARMVFEFNFAGSKSHEALFALYQSVVMRESVGSAAS